MPIQTSSYKLIATIPDLKLMRAFPLVKGKRYLLGSTEMEAEMLVWSHDRSLSRRQAWIEIVEDHLRVERHPQASQKLNGDEAITILELKDGESFAAGLTMFKFVLEQEGMQHPPDLTFVLSSTSFMPAMGAREVRDFVNVVGQMPKLMKANETPADFLLALCETLRTNVAGMEVSAWKIELPDDLPVLVALSPLEQASTASIANLIVRPSRQLVKQAMSLAGDECAVSVWNRRTTASDAGQSVMTSGAQWAMCIAISLAEHERFALYATGAHVLFGQQLNEVQQIFAAIGTMAKQHLLTARAKERQGQIGQFFSPALRSILFGDIAAADQALKPAEHEATICFFDLRGSSRLAEGMHVDAGKGADEGHFALLERILGNAASVIFETGGTVIDFQGDAILACWGIPPQGAPEHPAQQAILAARQIVELMADYDWPAIPTEAGVYLRCGIGLTCGKVLAGLFTAQGRQGARLSKYSVIGRAVNQAARLENLTKKFGVPILIDGALTAALAEEKILLRRIATVQPAGMNDAVEVHELVLPKTLGGSGINEEEAKAYEAALGFFEQGDFSAAAAALSFFSDDSIALFLREQIDKHRANYRPEKWRGVISLSAK